MHLHCEARYAEAVTARPYGETPMSPIPGLSARIGAGLRKPAGRVSTHCWIIGSSHRPTPPAPATSRHATPGRWRGALAVSRRTAAALRPSRGRQVLDCVYGSAGLRLRMRRPRPVRGRGPPSRSPVPPVPPTGAASQPARVSGAMSRQCPSASWAKSTFLKVREPRRSSTKASAFGRTGSIRSDATGRRRGSDEGRVLGGA
jgi:hypothetical protein